MNWARKISSKLKKVATKLDRVDRPSLQGTKNELNAILMGVGHQALFEQKVREEWTRTDLDYDPEDTVDEFSEAIEEADAKVVDEGPDHLKMDVVRGKEDELRELSEEMAKGRHGPELEEFAEAYGVVGSDRTANEGEVAYEVWSVEESSEGWRKLDLSSNEADPDAVKDDLNIKWEKAVTSPEYEEMAEVADLGPAEAVDNLSAVEAFGFSLPASGPGWIAKGLYGRLETVFAWKQA
jgi:hypothetical protein